jgi:pimeloyl-ACP methyl ester carboxylesterase
MATMQPFPGLEHQPFAEGDGPATAVLVHGFPGTPAEVRPLAAALVAVGWRVRAPLLPGFGRTGARCASVAGPSGATRSRSNSRTRPLPAAQ